MRRPRAAVANDQGLVAASEDPLVGPFAHRGEHREQRLALLGQAVLEALALFAHVDPLEDLVVDQMLKPRREHVLRDAEAALEVARSGARRRRRRG